jgi:putative membrane protein
MKKLTFTAALLVLAALAPAAQAQHCGQDETWLTSSMQGDRFEIQGGKMALQKSTNPAVRTLAQTLVTDHTKSLKDASHLARAIGLDVPKKPSPSEQWELQTVSAFTGNQFDRSWSSLEDFDHHQDITETKDEVKLGCGSAIRKDARQEIPTLEKHLKLSRAALASTTP